MWYFFNDVYPPLHNGHRPLDPPAFWINLFEDRRGDVDDEQEDTRAAPVENDIAAAVAPEVR